MPRRLALAGAGSGGCQVRRVPGPAGAKSIGCRVRRVPGLKGTTSGAVSRSREWDFSGKQVQSRIPLTGCSHLSAESKFHSVFDAPEGGRMVALSSESPGKRHL